MQQVPAINKWLSSGQDVRCWSCEHFQPSNNFESETTQLCNGVCRKGPPALVTQTQNDNADPPGEPPPNWQEPSAYYGYFPFIPFGNLTWCSGYQVALVQLGSTPPLERYLCQDGTKDTAKFPSQYGQGPIFAANQLPRKKPITESCWYCEHFQKLGNPATPDDPGHCEGYCMMSPAGGFQEGFQQLLPASDIYSHLRYDQGFPRMQYAPYMWCSRWERSTLPVPAYPTILGVPCGSNPIIIEEP